MRTVIVTGAANGLGKALVDALINSHFYVIGVDKMGPERQDSHSFWGLNCDLADPEDIKMLCEAYLNRHQPGIDCLINCAAINLLDYIENITTKAWDKVMAVNVRAPYLLVQALLPKLAESKGTVLNIISDAAYRPMTASLAYNASKAALEMMTRQMARELTRRHGITVFGVAPAKILGTKMSEYVDEAVPRVRGWTPEYAAEYHRAGVLQKEDIDVNELARFIATILAGPHTHLSGCILPYGG